VTTSGSPWLRAYRNEPPAALDPSCVTCTQPEHDPDVIAFTDHWKVVLHPDQTTAGSCLVGCRRHARSVSSLTAEEAADFHLLFKALEPGLEAVIGADLINLSCLRNWAFRAVDPEPPFRDGAPSPHVHWHVATRYQTPRTIQGVTFDDVDFGEELVWRGRRVDAVVRRSLMRSIRSALPVTLID
jgi:diadenosine tetraphosphate (Ap4A) HIT family hydrolase